MDMTSSQSIIDVSFGDIRGGPHEGIRTFVSDLAAQEWGGYTPPAGLIELRKELASYLQDAYQNEISSEHILVTSGASSALSAIYSLLTNKTVLIPEPGFPLYHKMLTQMDIAYNYYPLNIDTGWDDTLQAIEAGLQQGATAVIWNFPNNPLGLIPPEKVVQKFCELCQTYKALCISDEVYRDFNGGQSFVSPVRWLPDQTLLVYSFSKAFAMAGARIGCIAGHPLLIRKLTKIHWNTGMSSAWLSQKAAIHALTYHKDYPQRLAEDVSEKMECVTQLLSNADIPFYASRAGIFVCMDIAPLEMSAVEFADLLYKNHRIIVMPGKEFGESAQSLIRISMGEQKNVVISAIHQMMSLYTQLIKRQEVEK
ncbi:pyridoxal phosphate-dependent aminotransferase [Paenibacillus kandeliae]|uniref:pyridoxal phosphate-dependent aminotransferase n=1 Tax=Paenibacillus kandeliae TaxID=3231269 RepID=UPI003459B14F